MRCYILFLMIVSLAFSQERAVTAKGDTVLLFKDGTYQKVSKAAKKDETLFNKIKQFAKEFNASATELEEAYELANSGWTYTLPVPKSNQAMWGNSDGRTTWWYGYWYNKKTKRYSSTKPEKKQSGRYLGDDQNQKGYYRNGGSPRYPDNVERILSKLK